MIAEMERAYEEVINFIAAGVTPDQLVAFRPSEAASERVAELIERKKGSMLLVNEESELNHYLQFEHLMRLVKARAQQYLANP